MILSNKKLIQILVANSSYAKFYQSTNLGKDLELTQEYIHPESREKADELVTDRQGRYRARSGKNRGAYVSAIPKEVEAEKFALQLAHALNSAHLKDYDELIVIAPPHFHGLLNKHYPANVRAKIKHAIEKDYTKIPQKSLLNFLEDLKRFKLAA